MDALTIEITVADAMRRPLGGLAPASLADLMAVAEIETGLDAALHRSLAAFAARIRLEILDLPPAAIKALVGEFGTVEESRIPQNLRASLVEGIEQPGNAAVAASLLDTVSGWAEPEAFAIGGQARRVQRAPEARRDDRRFKDRRVGGRGEPATRVSRRESGPQAKTLDLSPGRDDEREKWVEQACLTRLDGSSGDGLLEAVLLAGVCHGARSKYPDLGGHEVKNALNRLKDRSKVRFSAGRWSSAGSRRW